jgi:ATP-binding cassette subfamily F protein uup
LDEPTNDLDIITLNILEEYLATFKGCVIVVSHDRYFMDKVVDHVLVFKGQGEIKDFPGNYTQYREADSDKRLVVSGKRSMERETVKPLKSLNPLSATSGKTQQTPLSPKLSFKEKRELELLEQKIPELEAEQSRLETELSSETLSSGDLYEKSQRIGQIIKELDEKTLRWIELSEKI